VKAILLSLAVMAQGTPTPSLELAGVRFYRLADSQTVVDLFCQVPLAALDPIGGEGMAAYRIAVTVRDSAGLELVARSWSRTVPTRFMAVARGVAVEHLEFTAPRGGGRYTIDVAVTDSLTGRVTRGRLAVDAYRSPPVASDLLLATGIRQAAAEEVAVSAGEIQKGRLLLEASGRPVLTPQQARLSYYLELYSQRAETASVAVRVKTVQGTQVVETGAERVALPAGGGVTRGVVDLAGLPPGDYGLELVAVGADSMVRRAAFRMAGFETEPAIAELTPGGGGGGRDLFTTMTEAQMDTLYLPLVYLMAPDEQGVYPSLPVDRKRGWLRRFWQRRDPTAGTPRNEAQEDFYVRIAEANRRFREGGAAEIPGWRTDRGRIFIKYGPPDEVLSPPQTANSRPYEVWKYTRVRTLKYVFLDQTLFGNYALIWTDDRREPSRPNWQELLGPEAVAAVERF
jgi:GWxTD domain-containing protein